MSTSQKTGLLAIAAVLSVTTGLTTASAGTSQTISSSGVGDVALGKSFDSLHHAGLVGALREGCSLAPNSRAAKLKRPLRGAVNFSTEGTPKAENIQVTGGGTTEEGIEVGSSRSEVKSAYPSAKFDHSTESVFGITLVKVPKRAGGKFQLALSVDSKKVTVIGVPTLAFCE